MKHVQPSSNLSSRCIFFLTKTCTHGYSHGLLGMAAQSLARTRHLLLA